MDVKLSIIIPVYNAEKYLWKCLDSAIDQTLKEIEIICINDGSTDNSLNVIEYYLKDYANIKLLNQENQGAAVARNNGIKMASGEFIAFMDPDDYYPDSDILKKLYEKAIQNDAVICGGSFCHNRKGKLQSVYQGDFSKYAFQHEGFVSYRDYQFNYGYTRFIYNREFLVDNNIFFPPYRRYQDPPFMEKAMILAGKFYAVPDISYVYRVGYKSIDWTEEKTGHMLNGIIDNLRMSRQAGFKQLHLLEVSRIFKGFKQAIKINIYEESIQNLLQVAFSSVKREWVVEEDWYKKLILGNIDEENVYDKYLRDI